MNGYVPDAEAFAAWVRGLPPYLEPDLVRGDVVSTAFYEAHAKGWTVEVLTADSQSACTRVKDGSSPVGILVHRLRTLATRSPMARDGKRPVGPRRYVAHTAQRLPAAWVVERRRLIAEVAEHRISPDVAEQAMVDLIAEQHARSTESVD